MNTSTQKHSCQIVYFVYNLFHGRHIDYIIRASINTYSSWCNILKRIKDQVFYVLYFRTLDPSYHYICSRTSLFQIVACNVFNSTISQQKEQRLLYRDVRFRSVHKFIFWDRFGYNDWSFIDFRNIDLILTDQPNLVLDSGCRASLDPTNPVASPKTKVGLSPVA